jgi:hypothetical protein
MDPNLLSATLSDEDQQAILAALNTILQRMPFLIDLTTRDRRKLFKLGDKSVPFVRKALEVATHHQTMFSPQFLQEMQKDADLVAVLAPIRVAVDALQKKIEDTNMQAGAEAFAAARTIYSLTKTPFGNAALRIASNDLHQRFRRRPKQNKTAPSTDSAAAAAAESST